MTDSDRTQAGAVAPADALRPWHLRVADAIEPHRTWLRLVTLAGLLIAGFMLAGSAALAGDAGTGALLRKVAMVSAVAGGLAGLALCGHWLVADLQRFSLMRIRAMAGICFVESMRRRVWLVAPLAMAGVVVVTQFTRPLDEQDAIRLTTKYCLLATGFVVVVAAILLAGTNLPKEIESRVIFTIVTKPTTRLEIVLGKIAGFSAVTAMLLLVMGLFTLVYVEAQAWVLRGQIQTALSSGQGEATDRARLEYYAAGGLTTTKAIDWPADMQVYGKLPSLSDGVRWIAGGQTTYFVAPFQLSADDRKAMESAVAAASMEAAQASPGRAAAAQPTSPFSLLIRVRVEEAQPSPEEREELGSGNVPREDDYIAIPGRGPGALLPQFYVMASNIRTGKPAATAALPGSQKVATAVPLKEPGPGDTRQFRIALSEADANELYQAERFNIEVSSLTPTLRFGVLPDVPPLVLEANVGGQNLMRVAHQPQMSIDDGTSGVGGRHDPPGIRFYSRIGRNGMQVTGRAIEDGGGPGGVGVVAVYSYTGVPMPSASDGKVTVQTRIAVDRGGELDADENRATTVQLEVRNRKTGVTKQSGTFSPVTNRLTDVAVDASAFEGGDFDIIIHGLTPGQYLGASGLMATIPSIGVVSAQHPFAWNLLKSLTLLWLLSVLVITIAVFCSTFLSWPIAVVLTVLLLLGRWGVNELGEAILPGASRGTVSEIFRIKDPAKGRAVTESMELLNGVLRGTAAVLPDISRFPVVEDINRGVSIAPSALWQATREVLLYGMPLIAVTYLVLRNKEVAP
jgi:hypothetical protein